MARKKKVKEPLVIDVESNLCPEFKDLSLEELIEIHKAAHEKTKGLIEEIFASQTEPEEINPDSIMSAIGQAMSESGVEKQKELNEAARQESRLEQEIVLRMFGAHTAGAQ
jgi:hypothetical protein